MDRLETFRREIENVWIFLNQRSGSLVAIEGITIAHGNYHRSTMMLDSRFRIVWNNRAALACLQTWQDSGRGRLKSVRAVGPLPSEFLATCEGLREQWFIAPSMGILRKSHVVRHARDVNHVATIKLYGVRLSEPSSPNFVVQFEQPAYQP